MASPMADDPKLKDKTTELFASAMGGQWDNVVKMYGEGQWAHEARLTKAGGTALHIAISDGREEVVKQMVGLITTATVDILIQECPTKQGGDLKDGTTVRRKLHPGKSVTDIDVSGEEIKPVRVSKGPLYIGNEQGNTPLHLAAAMGNVQMCRCIAAADPQLAGCQNKDGENPIFTAALYGKKDAFLRLVNICDLPSKRHGYSRGSEDGDTILHAAIAGEYFDLAFQIMYQYPDLINAVNESGQSPLHLLASKPSAFRSGSHLNRLNTITYSCTFVERLEVTPYPKREDARKGSEVKKERHPKNYETCIDSGRLLREAIKTTGNLSIPFKNFRELKQSVAGASECCNGNAEPGSGNPNESESCYPDGLPSPRDYNRPFPPNYSIFFEYVKLISKAMLIILGLGSREIRKVAMKKRKHTHCIQVLDKLLENAKLYEDIETGTRPPRKQDDETKFYDLTPETMEDTPETPSAAGSSQDHGGSNKNGKLTNANQTEAGKNRRIQGMERKETTVAISSKNGFNDLSVEKIRSLLPMGIYDMNSDKSIVLLAKEKKRMRGIERVETPVLIAAKNGITEIIKRILEKYPVAIHDVNPEKKNMVHLAVEHRQPHVYEFLLQKKIAQETVFRGLDEKGNSALHLAAVLRDYKPWNIPGAALQMQWELKWYKYVKNSMPLHFFVRYNKDGKTPKDIFTESHKELVQKGGEWLNSTSNSCSVVAALIATVAFATSATVPGGNNSESGTPTLEHHPAFNVFAVASLVALAFSVTSVIMFLAILTSRHQEKDFGQNLPRRLIVGLTSLFVSIGAILVSFCAGHFFVLRDELKYAAIPVYGITCLPVTFFAVAQFPLYIDLLWAKFKRLPQRSYRSVP